MYRLNTAPRLSDLAVISLALLAVGPLTILGGCHDSWNLVGQLDGQSSPAACEASYRNELALLSIGNGDRSHWLAPWRGYSETRPAQVLSLGLGMGVFPQPNWIALFPRLAQAGFLRVAVETHWAMLSFDGPARFTDDEGNRMNATLRALADNRIRPKLLLDSTAGLPCPYKNVELTTSQPAARGARQLRLDARSAALVLPGRTRLNGPQGNNALVLIASITADGTATLSRSLDTDIPVGALPVLQLAFAPFAAPTLPSGQPNPAFETTLAGWIDYARTVVDAARTALGPDGFDIEITRVERSFFDARSYTEDVSPSTQEIHAAMHAIISRTATELRSKGLVGQNVALADGLSNVDPHIAAQNLAPQTNAIVRRGAIGKVSFGGNAGPLDGRPLDALGETAGAMINALQWQDEFEPAYDALLPERPLTAIQTDGFWRDLAPFATNDDQGISHGRLSVGPQIWVSSVSLNPVDRQPALTVDERWRFQTKATLRAAVAYVGSGADAVFFNGPLGDPNIGLVDPALPTGGPVLDAMTRLHSLVATPAFAATNARILTLTAVGSCSTAQQFQGNNTARFPSLLDRDVVAFFPFQTQPGRFVAFAYVMTRNLARPQGNMGIELPVATFTLRIRGVRGERASASVVDLTTGQSVPVTIKSRASDEVLISLGLNDTPRAIVLSD